MADSLSKGVRYLFLIAIGTLFVNQLVQSQNFVPNELIVKFRSNAPDSVLSQFFLQRNFSAVASQSYTQSIRKISPLAAPRKSVPSRVSVQSPARCHSTFHRSLV